MSLARLRLGSTILAVGAALLGLRSNAAAADGAVDLHVYGNTDLWGMTNAPAGQPSVSFGNGALDLFPTARLGKVDVLAEIAFEAGFEDNAIAADAERAQVRYTFGDWLRFTAGRTHTAFGYYNDTYHHGQLFQLTTSRPQLVEFEDGGGLLVAHMVGFGANGTLAAGGAGKFEYNVEAGNGRGYTPAEVTNAVGRKDNKAFNLRLRWLPSFVEGLTIGANVMLDEIPVGPAGEGGGGAGAANKLSERIAGAHVALVNESVRFVNEFVAVQHKESGTSRTFNNWGGFSEFGYGIDDFTPYARVEYIKFANNGTGNDPFYQLNDNLAGLVSYMDVRLGLNWLADEHMVVKVEGEAKKRDLGSIAGKEVDSPLQIGGRVQFAFGF